MICCDFFLTQRSWPCTPCDTSGALLIVQYGPEHTHLPRGRECELFVTLQRLHFSDTHKADYCRKVECVQPFAPMDFSPPGPSVHGIFQARMLECVAMAFSRGSSQPRNQTHISCGYCTAGRFFTSEPPGKPRVHNS